MEDELHRMVHRDDPSTSLDAAANLLPRLNTIQKKVLDALRGLGPMTDEELELLPQFADYGPSTIRKRRSELYQAGLVVEAGRKRNTRKLKMIIWRYNYELCSQSKEEEYQASKEEGVA